MVTLRPALSTGKMYVLSLGSGQITDAAMWKNPYSGTSFTFYTPLELASTGAMYPANGAQNVAKETSIRFRFKDAPRLGPTPGIAMNVDPVVRINNANYLL